MRGPKVLYLFGVVMALFVVAEVRNPRPVIAQPPSVVEQVFKQTYSGTVFIGFKVKGLPSEVQDDIKDIVKTFSEQVKPALVTSVVPEYTCNFQVPQVGCQTQGVWITYLNIK